MPQATAPMRQPKLSEVGLDLLGLTRWQRARAIAWPLVSFAAFWVLAVMGQWVGAVFSLIVLSFVTYGSSSHDLVHGSLGINRVANDILLAIIELLCLRSGHAYQYAHLNHHAKFPHEDDVEAQAARMSFLGAVLHGVVFQFRIYAWALRTTHGQRNWIIAEGIGVAALVLGALTALPWTTVPAVYVALMIAGSWAIPLATSYLPHDAKASDALHQTRLFRGAFFRLVALDHLYHLEHHLYPAVPHQNWPRLAKRLDPWFEAAGILPARR